MHMSTHANFTHSESIRCLFRQAMFVPGLGFGLVPPSALLSRALSVSYSNQDVPVGLLFSECYAPLFRGVNVSVCIFIPRRQHAYFCSLHEVPPALESHLRERHQRSFKLFIFR